MATTLGTLKVFRLPLRLWGWALLPAKAIITCILRILSWITDAWCQMLTSWGGQTVASSAVHQLTHYQSLITQLQRCALQQKHELQELREQLSAAAAVKSALSLKYKQARAINTQLRQSLTDMEADASAAAEVISKVHVTPRSPQHMGEFSSPYQPSKSQPRGASSDRYHQARRRGGFIWSTHVALMAACVAMRWCDGHMQAAMEVSVRGGGTMSGAWVGGAGAGPLPALLLPVGSTKYWFGTWGLVFLYMLWAVRIVPSREAVNRSLSIVGWVTVGCCLQLGWISQRLVVLMENQVATSSVGMAMGATGGQVMVGGGAQLPMTYVQVPARSMCTVGGSCTGIP